MKRDHVTLGGLLWKNGGCSISSVIIYLAYFVTITPTELVVNVKNQGGEVFQESIWANLSDETVHLEVEQPDGSVIIQFIDFRNEIQVINAFVLGEEERHESQFQVLCFVTHFQKSDFIPFDAMAKLRQKNPWTVRVPERDLGKEIQAMDVLLDITSADWISPHIKSVCADAKDTTYGTATELEAIVALKSLGKNNETSVEKSFEAHELFLRTVKPFPVEQAQCGSASDKPCQCQFEVCIGWYPCALKYCQVHDSSGKASSSYRCGIHTCRKCRRFTYSVSRNYFCI